MKHVFFTAILILIASSGTFAQNRSIRFESSLKWQELVEKAKADKKLLFIDCYTSWCAPCKQLSDNVFTKDGVADYFNKEFVNAHYDMEKDPEGAMLATKYMINSYPTLLFIDPETQDDVHRVSGAGDVEWLLGEARTAKDVSNNMSGMYKRYKAGERDTAFIREYLKMLSNAQMLQMKKEIVNDYMKTVPEQLFYSEEVWNIATHNIDSPLDQAYQRIMGDLQKSYSAWGQKNVDALLGKVIRNHVFFVYNWKRISRAPLDEKWNDEVVTYLSSLSYPAIPQALLELRTAKCVRDRDFAGALECMKDAFELNVFTTGGERVFLLESMELFTGCKDQSVMDKAIAWLDSELQQTDNYLYKSNLVYAKYLLYRSCGRDEEARKANEDKNTYFEEGSRQCGGRVLRMVKPE